MKAELTEQHQWLEKLLGDWTTEADIPVEPGQPPIKSRGTETVRSLGGAWIVAEGRGEMPDGSPATMILTLGYDPASGRFAGTWIGSMMTHLWVYTDAQLDASGKALALFAEGPVMGPGGPIDGATARYKEVIEFKSDDHRTFTSYVQGEDGQWNQMMVVHYHRKK